MNGDESIDDAAIVPVAALSVRYARNRCGSASSSRLSANPDEISPPTTSTKTGTLWVSRATEYKSSIGP